MFCFAQGKGDMFTHWLLSDDRSRFKKLFRAKSTDSESTPRVVGGRDGTTRRPSRRPDDHNRDPVVVGVDQANGGGDFLGLLRDNNEASSFTDARRRSDGDRRRMMMRLGLHHQRKVFDANSPTRSSSERLPPQPQHPTLPDHSDDAVISAQRACADDACNRKCNSFRSPRSKGRRDEVPVALLMVTNGGLNCSATHRRCLVVDGDGDGHGYGDEEENEGEQWESDRLLEETIAVEEIHLRDISTLCV